MTLRRLLQQLPLLLQVVVLYGAIAFILHSSLSTPVAPQAATAPLYYAATPSRAILSGTPVRLEIPRLGIILSVRALLGARAR